jgi:putative ABC transport system permease protein
VKLRALDRKLLRDLRTMRGQLAAIILVIVAGVATYVSMQDVKEALQDTLDNYYRDYRFADGFATVRRAPEQLEPRLLAVSGVAELETRVSAPVNLEVREFSEPIAGQITSLPQDGQPALNRLFLRVGRLPRSGREGEVVLNEVFADAHGLLPGDTIDAILNGRRRALQVVGVALSPEHILQVQPGSLFPDPERYGVLWMHRTALAAAYDMEGAFNDIAFTITTDADIDDVIARLDLLLAPYGGAGAIPRKDQGSHFYITGELGQLRGTATLLPAIFIGVAAFLLNIVISRLISLQREQIGALKAFGYTNRAIAVHYLKLVLLVAVTGAAAGGALGLWLSRVMGDLYIEHYRFPQINYPVSIDTVIEAFLLTGGAATLGVLHAVGRAGRLAPAAAMRAAAPAIYRRSWLERVGLDRYLDQPTRMITRHLERQPLRSALSILGVASACAILIMGLFFTDSFKYIIHTQYGLAQRQDLSVSFREPTSTKAVYELAALPGVLHAEPFRVVPVRLRAGHRSHMTAIEGLPRERHLRRVIDAELRAIDIPAEGIVLTQRLAQILDVRPGAQLVVEVREGARVTRTARVAALTEQYVGVAAYMDLAALNRLARSGPAISGAYLMTDGRADGQLNLLLRKRSRVTAILSHERAIAVLMESYNRSIRIVTSILALSAGIIAFGVVYNSARISLSERDRELASLRVLGFTRAEAAYIMLGELALLTLAAIPVGLLIGALASVGLGKLLETDLYQLPVIISRGTYGLAAVVVLVAALLSALIVRQRVHRLDLIAVLKTRE